MSIYAPKRKIKWRYKILLLVLVFGALIFWPHNNIVNQLKESVTQGTVLQKSDKEQERAAKLATEKKQRAEKQQAVLSSLQISLGVNDKFGIAVYDINHDELFGINETEQFHAASVMKLLVATTALTDIEKGRYSLNTTVKGHLQQMINQSNNNSWEYFNQLQGFDHQQEVADALELNNVKVWGNFMSAKGVQELLLKLYKGEILTAEHRQLLFSYMQKTETENRISPSIPQGVNFYHKTGTYGGGIHDAAIVIHPENPFILVVFSNDSKGVAWETRFKAIQEATTTVYNYFSEI